MWSETRVPLPAIGGWCRLLIFAEHYRYSGWPVLRVFCEGRVPRTSAAAKLGHSIPERNLRPAFIHAHRPGFVQKIETITTPPPLLRCANQASLHRIAMHIPKLLHALLRRPYVEVVGACLPERSALWVVSKQIALTRVPPLALRQQSVGRALLRHLYHGRGSPNFRFRQKQVNMFRHHDI